MPIDIPEPRRTATSRLKIIKSNKQEFDYFKNLVMAPTKTALEVHDTTKTRDNGVSIISHSEQYQLSGDPSQDEK